MTHYQIMIINASGSIDLVNLVNAFLRTIEWGDFADIQYDWGNTTQRAVIRYVKRDGVPQTAHSERGQDG